MLARIAALASPTPPRRTGPAAGAERAAVLYPTQVDFLREALQEAYVAPRRAPVAARGLALDRAPDPEHRRPSSRRRTCGSGWRCCRRATSPSAG